MLRRSAAFLVAVGALTATPATAFAAPPLIGQWPLDGSYEDGAEEVTPDASGNGLGLRAPNGVVHLGTPARFGTGATLGTNLTPLRVTSPLLAPAQVTLLAWIRQAANPGTLRYIAGRGDDALTCGGSTWALYTGYPAMPGLRFYVRTGAGGSALTPAPADGTVFNGEWHLIAGTYDGTAARLYVDGVPVGAPAVAPPGPLKYALGGGNSFYVDGYAVEGCSLFPNADDWPGPIDEVRVYDRALSASELARLAATTGPNAPDLVTDASLVPPPTPAAEPAAPAAGVAGGVGAASGLAQVRPKPVPAAGLAQTAKGVRGASQKELSDATTAALAAAHAKAVEAMRNATGKSQVSAAKATKELSAAEAKRTKPDPRIQARLDAMQYGIATQVPAAAGEIVEAVATIALEKKRKDGKVATQTIVLPPAVGIAGAKRQAQMQVPVDEKAAAAMAKRDIAKAAISVQAANLGRVSEMSELESLRLQAQLDRMAATTSTLTNLLQKLSETEQAIARNAKGGVTGDEIKKQKELQSKADKLDRDARAIEKQRDEANQKAAQAMQAAAAALAHGLASGAAQAGGALPAASSSLSGCKTCELAALLGK